MVKPVLQLLHYYHSTAVLAQSCLPFVVPAQVVCSEGVHKAAAAVSENHTHPCLLAPVTDTQQQLPNVEWACLITKHVCLNLMVPDEPEATAHLGRYRTAMRRGCLA